MFGKKSCEVLVVGAGPVGLYTALMLAERAVRVRIVEEQFRSTTRSYALALHPTTLDVLEEVGLLDRLVASGLRLDTLAFYGEGRRLGELNYGALETSNPYVLVLPQSELEQALVERLTALGVEVDWNHRVTALEPEADFVTVGTEKLTKESVGYATAHTEWAVEREESMRASFVVGADGHASRVRRQLGLPFPRVGQEQHFAVFELITAGAALDEARILLGEGLGVLWPLGNGRYRCSFAVSANETAAVERDKSRVVPVPGYGTFGQLEPAVLRRLLAERAPWFEPRIVEVIWSLALRFERRLVPELGLGRVWLAGDAAHLAAPIGVHSLNLGLQEARDLCRHLYGALRAGLPVEAVAAFGREWQPRLAAHFSPQPLRMTPAAPDWARRYASVLHQVVPASGEDLTRLLEQIGVVV